MGKFAELAAKLEDIEKEYPDSTIYDVDLEYNLLIIRTENGEVLGKLEWKLDENELMYLSRMGGASSKDIIQMKDNMEDMENFNEWLDKSERTDSSKEN